MMSRNTPENRETVSKSPISCQTTWRKTKKCLHVTKTAMLPNTGTIKETDGALRKKACAKQAGQQDALTQEIHRQQHSDNTTPHTIYIAGVRVRPGSQFTRKSVTTAPSP